MTELFELNLWGMSALELFAACLGLFSVGLTVMRNIWCWPIGAVMVALYTWIFWQAKLYADSGLQVIYFCLQLYGWWYWLNGGQDREEAPVARTATPLLVATILAGTLFSAVAGYLLSAHTDQALPYGDATVTVFSLIAQVLMTRKRLENWLLWIFVNMVACCVYWIKGLHPTAVLYGVFLIMAILGWREWRRALLQQAETMPQTAKSHAS